MTIDTLTFYGIIFCSTLVAVVIAIAVCNGCCIAKMLGKPCPPK